MALLDEIVALNIMPGLMPLFENRGYYINAENGKIMPGPIRGIDHRRKWLFVNPMPGQVCDFYQQMFFGFGFVPTPCLGCWKVVVKMYKIKHLMQLKDLMLDFVKGFEGVDRFCKCGIEERSYTFYNYGAYFYCKDQAQGIKRKKQVRAMVDNIDPRIEVILKRYCTEYEIKCGPTDTYNRPESSHAIEKEIFDNSVLNKVNIKQPPFLVRHLIFQWLKFAYEKGDETALEYNDGKPFYTQCVTYDKEG